MLIVRQELARTCGLDMCDSVSAAVRKMSSDMVVARVSTAAKPIAGNTYALFTCHSHINLEGQLHD